VLIDRRLGLRHTAEELIETDLRQPHRNDVAVPVGRAANPAGAVRLVPIRPLLPAPVLFDLPLGRVLGRVTDDATRITCASAPERKDAWTTITLSVTAAHARADERDAPRVRRRPPSRSCPGPQPRASWPDRAGPGGPPA
jgi:hypothetical protein